MINYSIQNNKTPEVYHSISDGVGLDSSDIHRLVEIANQNTTKRARFCVHQSSDDLLHEMFIVHPKNTYVRPHMHQRHSESMLVVDGEADYVIFNDAGGIDKTINMGDYMSGHQFYQNTAPGVFHTILIKTEWLVFLECTLGPFNKDDMVYPDWSPEGSDTGKVNIYVSELLERLAR